MSSAHEVGTPTLYSLGELGTARLGALCDALELSEGQTTEALSIFRLVSEPWGRLPIGAAPAWENDLTDDGTPFEFSVGFEAGTPELRMLFESQLDAGKLSQHSSWHAGIALQARLRARGLCETAQFDRVAPLFAPGPDYLPRFALWHAAVLRERGPLFKCYVNPEVVGVDRSRPLAAAALGRLGLASAWAFVESRLGAGTRLPYLSLDLVADSSARVKIYLTASHSDEVEALLAGCSNHTPGQTRNWFAQLLSSEGPYLVRPVLVCYSFRPGDAAPNATVHIPIRSYVPSDEVALNRTTPLLPSVSARQLTRSLAKLAAPTLSCSQGVLTYVSLRMVDGHPRVTTYLAPRAYTLEADEHSSGTIPTGRASTPAPANG
jgi:hypothetical protein